MKYLATIWTEFRYRRWTAVAGALLVLILMITLAPLPDPLFSDPYATTLRSSDGRLLSAAIAKDQQWRFPEMDTVPQKFSTAIRMFEDRRFYYHPGIDPVAIARAVRDNLRAGKVVSGGSTLTMQTVRMAMKNQPRTYLQKLIEVFAALKLDLFSPKNEILLAYANHAPFGGNIVGLNAASWRYYGRPPDELSWAETAALAILPNNPSAIFPGRGQTEFQRKRDRLLDILYEKGYLDKDELFLAREEPLPSGIRELPDEAFHLLHRAMTEGMKGRDVVSTLQYDLQHRLTRMVDEYGKTMAANEIHNVAALVIEVRTGNVVSYVGNARVPGDHGYYVDIINSRRSPGSLLKPFLYAAALDDSRLLPASLVPDIPLFYRGFAPQNFDKQFRGMVHADQALAGSLNVPFVHLLLDYGYEKFHQKLKKLGMHSLDRPAGHYGLSLILGGGETTLWELTGMYAGMVRTYENFTERPLRHGYSPDDFRENNYVGTSVGEEQLSENGLLSASSIGYTLRAMQTLNRPEQEIGWEQFRSARKIAWKTGTSYGFRDAWAIGMNEKYVVGIWTGNADGEGRPGLTGVRAAAPLLFNVFKLLDGGAVFDEPMGEAVTICSLSGMKAGPDCADTFLQLLPEGSADGHVCSFHRQIHLDQEEQYQVNSSCYAINRMVTTRRFVLPPVEAWYYKRFHPSYKALPAFCESCQTTNAGNPMELIYPNHLARVIIPLEQDGQKGKVIFKVAHDDPHARVYWHLDNTFIGETTTPHQMGIQTKKGDHRITLVDGEGHELRRSFKVL